MSRASTPIQHSNPSKALLAGEPRLGTRFSDPRRHPRLAARVPDAPKPHPELTVKSYLVGKLGPRGFGRLLQKLETVAVEAPKKRRRPRRRKPVAA